MRIVCISDTHNLHDQIVVPYGDLLIHAGDMTRFGTPEELTAFAQWLGAQPHQHKVVIAGNHDGHLQGDVGFGPQEFKRAGAIYLQDCGASVGGLTIWGSPWTPAWQGKWYFHLARNSPELAARWARIPDRIDVLVTHGPAYGTLDIATAGVRVGCELLALELGRRICCALHVFGHVHQSSGVSLDGRRINAAVCDHDYRPVNPARVVDV